MTYEQDPNYAHVSGAWGLLQRVYGEEIPRFIQTIRYWRESLFG